MYKTYFFNNRIKFNNEKLPEDKIEKILFSEEKQREYLSQFGDYGSIYSFFHDLTINFLPVENKLIKNTKYQSTFFKNILFHFSQTSEHTQRSFITGMFYLFLENKNYPKDWDLTKLKNKPNWISSVIDDKDFIKNIIYEELLYNGKKALNYIEPLSPLKDVVKLSYPVTIRKNNKVVKYQVDFKTKLMFDIYRSEYSRRKIKIELLDYIENNLNLSTNLPLLVELIEQCGLYHYRLLFLNNEKLNNYKINYMIDETPGKIAFIETTLLNAGKYNSMKKNLSEVLYHKIGYGLNKKEYTSFEDLANHFAEDPFLRENMHIFMKTKASRARKPEIRTKWNYFSIISQREFQQEKKNFKKVKI